VESVSFSSSLKKNWINQKLGPFLSHGILSRKY
jgi:hypothetical protein